MFHSSVLPHIAHVGLKNRHPEYLNSQVLIRIVLLKGQRKRDSRNTDVKIQLAFELEATEK